MPLTVEYLKKILEHCPDNMVVVDHENRDFIHIINMTGNPQRLKMSSLPKIGNCNECGGTVHKTEVSDYDAVCTQCDENLYSFEFTPVKTQK
jgi:hypothetical protein